jgi:PTH1 family peptidyl-tRNA hydrolase
MNAASAPAVIFGLGNPGPKHAADRHNAGFWFVDLLATAAGMRFRDEARFSGSVCNVTLAGRAVRLVKPGTYMNRSGQCVQRLLDYFQIAIGDVLVVHDEIDLPPGAARLKFGGGHGGHNGLRDIIASCGADFRRLRIGVGHPGHKDAVVDYVLHAPGRDEQALIDEAIEESVKAIDVWFRQDLPRATTYLHTATPRDAGIGPAG